MRKNLPYLSTLLLLMASFYGCGGLSSLNVPIEDGTDGGDTPGVGAKIAFLQGISGGSNLKPFVGTVTQSGITTVSAGDAVSHVDLGTVVLSSDGQSIVYDLQGDIFVASADGTNPTDVSGNVLFDRFPAFSANDNKVVWTADQGSGGFDVMIANTDGTSVVNLTPADNLDFMEAALSPDGTKIAVSAENSQSVIDIWLLELEENGASVASTTNLTENSNAASRFPVFSSDGSKIYFTQDGADLDIYSIKTDGTSLTRITKEGADAVPRIVGSTLFTQSFRDKSWELYRMKLDGTGAVRMTNNNLYDGFITDAMFGPASSEAGTQGASKRLTILRRPVRH